MQARQGCVLKCEVFEYLMKRNCENCFKAASPVEDFIDSCRDAEKPTPGVSWKIISNERRVIGGG
jgi:hypothetical protein